MKPTKLLLTLISAVGVVSGLLLIIRPDGSLLRMPTSWLASTPVDTYFWPGLVILVGYGLTPLLLVRAKNEGYIQTYAILAALWLLFEAVVFDLFQWLHIVFGVLLILTALAKYRDHNPIID